MQASKRIHKYVYGNKWCVANATKQFSK
jgi:hypothetical protein